MKNILILHSSARKRVSISRRIVQDLAASIERENGPLQIVERDLVDSELPHLNESLVNAFYTPKEDRTREQNEILVLSNLLVKEIQQADIIIIGSPIYNFGSPAALKTWMDLVARVGVTFKFESGGSIGLLNNKKAFVVITSAGTPFGSDLDFSSGHIKQFLSFIGVEDVSFLVADQLLQNEEKKLKHVEKQIASISKSSLLEV